VGADVSFGREVVEAHLKLCLASGVTISGVNAEVMPGQWEYQVGPCIGISAADQMLISRYLMLRVGEVYDVVIRSSPFYSYLCRREHCRESLVVYALPRLSLL
jgi:glutamine synthetase